jgi:hypothetical protein
MKVPRCPQRGFEFTLLRSLKHWNPYKTNCPQCRAKLRVKHVTVFFGLSGLVGLAIAAVAIICEATHKWVPHDSLIFFAFAVPLIIVPFSIFLWSKSQYVFHKDA